VLRRPVDESLYSVLAEGVQRCSLDDSLSRSADRGLQRCDAVFVSGSWTIKVWADLSALNRSTDRSTAAALYCSAYLNSKFLLRSYSN